MEYVELEKARVYDLRKGDEIAGKITGMHKQVEYKHPKILQHHEGFRCCSGWE